MSTSIEELEERLAADLSSLETVVSTLGKTLPAICTNVLELLQRAQEEQKEHAKTKQVCAEKIAKYKEKADKL